MGSPDPYYTATRNYVGAPDPYDALPDPYDVLLLVL
jgi:hypothetical protein